MTDSKPPEPDDAELVARIEAATRLAPLTPLDLARFRARVVGRSAAHAPGRIALRLGIAASLAAAAVAVAALWTPRPEEVAPAQQSLDESLEDSFEEQVLFAPEWIERDDGFVDGEVLPESYALASALVDS